MLLLSIYIDIFASNDYFDISEILQIMTDLLRELAGNFCRCGNCKRTGHSFCRPCFLSLPHDLRDHLYRLAGAGYELAFKLAAEYLKTHGKWS